MSSLIFDSNDVRFLLTEKKIEKSGLLKSTFSREFKESIEKKVKLSLEFLNKSFSNTELTNIFNILFDDEEVLLSSNELFLGIYLENYLDMKDKKIIKELNNCEKFIFTTDTNWKVLIETYILSVNLNINWELKSNGLYILKKSLEDVTLDKLLEYLQEICNSSKDIWIGVSIYYQFFNVKELISIEQLEGAFIVDIYNNPEVNNLDYPFKDGDDISNNISKYKVWEVLNSWTFGSLGLLEDFVWENKDVEVFVGGDCIFDVANFLATNVAPIKKKVEFHIGIKSTIKSTYKVFINDLCKKLFGESYKCVKVEINENKTAQLVVYDRGNSKNKIILLLYMIDNCENTLDEILNKFKIKNRKVGFYKGELLFHPEAILSWINGCEDLYQEVDKKNKIKSIYSINMIRQVFKQGFGFIRKPKVVEWIDSIENLMKISHLPCVFRTGKYSIKSDYNYVINICIDITKRDVMCKIKNNLILDYHMFKSENLHDILLKNIMIRPVEKGFLFNNGRNNKLYFSNYILNIINVKTSFEENPFATWVEDRNSIVKLFYTSEVEDEFKYLYNFLMKLKTLHIKKLKWNHFKIRFDNQRNIILPRPIYMNEHNMKNKKILAKIPVKNKKLKVYIDNKILTFQALMDELGRVEVRRDNRLIINKKFQMKSVLELNFPEKGNNLSDTMFLKLRLFHDFKSFNNSQ